MSSSEANTTLAGTDLQRPSDADSSCNEESDTSSPGQDAPTQVQPDPLGFNIVCVRPAEGQSSSGVSEGLHQER